MKTRILTLIIPVLMLFQGPKLLAQEQKIHTPDTSQYKIELLDGTRLTGTIILENDSVIVMELQDLGELKIRKDKIDKMIPLGGSPGKG